MFGGGWFQVGLTVPPLGVLVEEDKRENDLRVEIGHVFLSNNFGMGDLVLVQP